MSFSEYLWAFAGFSAFVKIDSMIFETFFESYAYIWSRKKIKEHSDLKSKLDLLPEFEWISANIWIYIIHIWQSVQANHFMWMFKLSWWNRISIQNQCAHMKSLWFKSTNSLTQSQITLKANFSIWQPITNAESRTIQLFDIDQLRSVSFVILANHHKEMCNEGKMNVGSNSSVNSELRTVDNFCWTLKRSM